MHLFKRGALTTGSVGSITCSRIAISATGVSELDGDTVLRTLQRSQISRIKLNYESNAKYPFFQYLLGFTLLSLGLLGLLVALLAVMGNKSIIALPQRGHFALPLIPINLWLMIGIGFLLLSGIFRGRYLLLVETGDKTHKIFFNKTTDISEIQAFIRKAQTNFGYEIDVSMLENRDHES